MRIGNVTNEKGSTGSLYGAGGGGGTVRFDSSNNAIKGSGGNGKSGIAEIKYDLIYQAASGGGGGGGAFLKVENINVNPSTQYTIRVSGGGSGGAVLNNGSDGGETRVSFEGTSYTLSGGKGGKIGTSATSSSNVVYGIGGNGGDILTTISDTANSTKKAGSKGLNGSGSILGSIGGNGGESGIESKGGCGGLFDNGSNCSATTTVGLSEIFISPSNIFDTAEYGSAGSGGGGGGWAYNTTAYPTGNPGKGGDGQNGYVYVYWTKYE